LGSISIDDRYKGLAELLLYAKGVSAKSYNFNSKDKTRSSIITKC